MARFLFTAIIAWIFCLSLCCSVLAETAAPGPTAAAQNFEFEKLKRQAESGDAASQYALGLAYAIGKGVQQNYFTGIRWFKKAADQGHVEALVRLGVAYADNTHFKPDRALAMDYFRKAAEQGNSSAQYYLGDLYQVRSVLKEDKVEAVKWYKKAAEQGNPHAQLRLGIMYNHGVGIETNHNEALKLGRKAAEQGLQKAQQFLGYAYWHAKGETNLVEACAWLEIATDKKQSSSEAESFAAGQLSALKTFMTPQQLEQAQKRAVQLRAQIHPSQWPTYGLENMFFAD